MFGIFIGIALGLGLAAAIAFYLLKSGNPYATSGPAKDAARESVKDPAKAGRSETAAGDKPRFDFYKILPGVEEPKIQPKAAERSVPDRATADRAVSPDKTVAKADDRPGVVPPAADKPPKAAERFWLQAGSFANEADAENLKATMAFSGLEATVHSATLPDKGVRFRVRLGPYDNTNELARVKAELAKRGFDAAVIKF